MKVTKEIKELLKQLEVFFLDANGVIFHDIEFEGLPESWTKVKTRSHVDGQGITFLRALGIRVVIVTNASGIHAKPIENLVERWNSIPSVNAGILKEVVLYTGVGGDKKVEVASEFLHKNNMDLKDAAMMGDDVMDFELLNAVALRVAPYQAEKVIKDIAHIVTKRKGGEGAVRDFVNLILEVRELSPFSIIRW